jgi:hypothetical protein
MADNVPKHLYPTRDDNITISTPPYATQFEGLYNLDNQLLLKVDGDQTEPPSPNKQENIPSIPADAAFEGGNVDEYATPISANSTKTAYIDPRGCIDLLPRAFNDILPHVNASIPGLWTPRHEERGKFRTAEKRISSHDEYRHLACYGVYSATLDPGGSIATVQTQPPTPTIQPRSIVIGRYPSPTRIRPPRVSALRPSLSLGALQPSTCNDYVSILFLVPKPGNNQLRLICDFRPLNKYCVRKRLEMEPLLGSDTYPERGTTC